jgi:hypothetical protein
MSRIASLPLFHQIAGQRVLVLGDGQAAEPKRRLVERAGGVIIDDLPRAIDEGVRLAFIAYEDAAACEVAAINARCAGMLVNVVDRPELCDFTTPSILDRDPLLVAIGTGGKNIAQDKALDHVYGYGVGLDMTRRDLQGEMKKQGRPWEIGKSFDHSAPIGPITPAAQAGAIEQAALWLQVNGQDRQRSNVAKLIWIIAETIEHLSAAWDLQAGDLIYTGTPEGVAAVVTGDQMVGHVDGLTPITVSVGAA